ncbi:MAG: TonB family protein [Terriglobia bacterium]|jgi:TonB family protein
MNSPRCATNLFFACAILTAACQPATLVCAIEDRYQHAAELLALGNLLGAQGELETILKRRPDDKDAEVLLGVTLVRLSGKSAEKGDTTTAQELLGQALRLDPDEAYWHSIAAQLWSGQGDRQRVARECSQAAQLSPDDDGLKQRRCPSVLTRFGDGHTNPHGVKAVVTHSGGGSPGCFPGTGPILQSKSEPAYTEKARRAHYEGTVVLMIVVGADGNVPEATVLGPLGLGLDESALRTVHRWKFKPALRDGKPVAVRIVMEVTFKLYNDP